VSLERALSGLRGCLVVEDATGTVVEHDGTVPLTPASTQKLLVATAALSRLGPDFRFETKVVAERPVHDGVVDEAWLVGGGDPFLATADYAGYLARRPRTRDDPLTPLAALADELAARGVQSIPGGIHGDDSRYDRTRYVPSWNPSYVTEVEVGPIAALAVNQGLSAWESKRVAETDPPSATATALARLLQERNVAADPAAAQAAPGGAVVLAKIDSAPLSDVVAAMLRASDNFVAEVLLRELDHAAGGSGTTAGGAQVVEEEAAKLGLPVEGLHVVDGSGLDTGNRASCRALLATLSLNGQPQFSALDRGLAVAGQSGTLVRRFVGSPLAGRLAAKTGWINGVAAMVGRIDGPRLRFALIINGNFSWPAAQAVEDRVVGILGAYPG
jgi:D-alanyl-D-alanine carboxypeptidase/D-alanyl-D-alanine-endopeptidase (penicillin-binding protein 4)